MNCLKCKKRIATPLADYSVAELVEACRAQCLGCDPDQMPCGGRSQVRADEFTLTKALPTCREDLPDGCDGVTAEAFDRLRVAMFALFDLAPDDLLLVRHLVHGGSIAEFASSRGLTRQAVNVRRQRIVAAMPLLAVLQ